MAHQAAGLLELVLQRGDALLRFGGLAAGDDELVARAARLVLDAAGLVEVTDSLADKGVVFYAINLRENEGVVRDFMKKQKKQFLVLMDNGDVAAAYKVEPIPQTVIIGADGTVQAVHFGFTNRQLIRRELDMLLTGRNLVEPQK